MRVGEGCVGIRHSNQNPFLGGFTPALLSPNTLVRTNENNLFSYETSILVCVIFNNSLFSAQRLSWFIFLEMVDRNLISCITCELCSKWMSFDATGRRGMGPIWTVKGSF